MSIEDIERAISCLRLDEKEAIRDWLDDELEGSLPLRSDFKEKILQAQAEVKAGVYSRSRSPDQNA